MDVGVQDEFIRYLQERGINDDLASFIPELIEQKEQKVCKSLVNRRFSSHDTPQEYVKWLGKVKGFVDV